LSVISRQNGHHLKCSKEIIEYVLLYYFMAMIVYPTVNIELTKQVQSPCVLKVLSKALVTVHTNELASANNAIQMHKSHFTAISLLLGLNNPHARDRIRLISTVKKPLHKCAGMELAFVAD
jgi:hypothetical protein